MRVSKWGNSLAVRLPNTIVKSLKLKSGDEVEIVLRGDRVFQLERDTSRERALARLRAEEAASERIPPRSGRG
jgi:antitoxin MazE